MQKELPFTVWEVEDDSDEELVRGAESERLNLQKNLAEEAKQ